MDGQKLKREDCVLIAYCDPAWPSWPERGPPNTWHQLNVLHRRWSTRPLISHTQPVHMQERGQLLPSFVGQQLRRVGCMFSNPHQSSTSSHNFAMAFIPRQPEYGRDAMGGPLSYPAHISAVSALIKDTRPDWILVGLGGTCDPPVPKI